MADPRRAALMQLLQQLGGRAAPAQEPQRNKPPKPHIHHLAKRGSVEELKEYIKDHPDEINLLNPYYGTPLHRAVQIRGYEKVKILLDHGADPNLWAESVDEDKPRDFPCVFTALTGHDITLLRLLARAGANLNIRGPSERHPLHHAIIAARDNGSGDPVAILDEYFKLAKETGQTIEVNAIADSVYNKTPLHIAVGANFVGTARLLIENGADLDAQDKDGWTSLHVATSKERPAMIRLLLAHGASMNIRSTDRNNYLPSEMEITDRHCKTGFLMARTGAAFQAAREREEKEAN